MNKLALLLRTLALSCLLVASGASWSQEPLTTHCESAPIAALFSQFGKTGRMPPELARFLKDPVQQRMEPYKAFDNVYYVGICFVSAWLITSPHGHVLIDTVFNPFTDQLLQNIRTAGFDPQDIKLVLITHGHWDHAAGAARLKQALPGARFAMTREGWREAAEAAQQSASRPDAWTMPPPDIVLEDGQIIRGGDIAVQAFATPGHTMGTASYVYDVTDSGKRYRAITVGGLGLNAIKGPEQVEAFIASIKRIRGMMDSPDNPVTVHLTTHGFSNGLTETKELLKTRKPGEPNPLVDPAGFRRQLDALQAGAEKRLVEERAKVASADGSPRSDPESGHAH
jgi:metallo-beta-lactamase class B